MEHNKITLAEKEAILDLLDDERWPAIENLLKNELYLFERRVLDLNLTAQNINSLAQEKARYEGARSIVNTILKFKKNVIAKPTP